jgi:PAS domain S-box-containing protein
MRKVGRQITIEEMKELQQKNCMLANTVRELRLEMGYYKGETKRLELEKKILAQEIIATANINTTPSREEQHQQQHKSTPLTTTKLNDPEYLRSLVRYPSKPIAEVLGMTDMPVFMSSAQKPYFIEYANKSWAETCGWQAHDVLGFTTTFLQGLLTDSKATERFMLDIQEFGYGHMRVINYRRSGEMYICTIQAFPVFDSMRPDGPDAEVPVLTHFGCILSGIEEIAQQDTFMFFHGPDRRMNAKRFDKKCRMVPEAFLRFATSIRLSDLLRFMLCCEDAMILTSTQGQVIHVNKAWSHLTGYALSEIEGLNCSFLQGDKTDAAAVEKCATLSRLGQPSEMVTINYRKDRTEFNVHVMMVPVRGGYNTSEITHFCGLLVNL